MSVSLTPKIDEWPASVIKHQLKSTQLNDFTDSTQTTQQPSQSFFIATQSHKMMTLRLFATSGMARFTNEDKKRFSSNWHVVLTQPSVKLVDFHNASQTINRHCLKTNEELKKLKQREMRHHNVQKNQENNKRRTETYYKYSSARFLI